MEDIWIEKYRPKTLDEVAGQKEIIERLKSYVKTKNVPHLIFAGPAGTGKTTCALALSRELFGNCMKKALLIYAKKKELLEAQATGDAVKTINVVKRIIFNE